MKFIIKKHKKERKLVAVIDRTGLQYWFVTSGGTLKFFNGGQCLASQNATLHEILANDVNRTPVYEGDSVTIQF